jgi:hypothetical protein
MQVVELKMSALMAGSINSTSNNEVPEGAEGSPINYAPGMESGSDDLDW